MFVLKPIKKYFLVLLTLLMPVIVPAQDAGVMTAYQQELQKLFDKVFHAPTDNERYNANEQATTLFKEAEQQPGAFNWDWQLGREVSVLKSKDKAFRIITWAVVRDNGEYECFGLMEVAGEGDAINCYTLHDKSDDIINVEESVLSPDNWYGAVYQDIIETKYEGKTYYTLLGWTGVDALTQRKVIEPVRFRGSAMKPEFGQNLFRRDKNRRRVVLEYSNSAMVNLQYDEQFVRTFENKRMKGKKGRIINVQQQHDEKAKMIIFDEIGPMVLGMDGLFQYYVPTGTEKAYVFTDGRWEMQGYAFGEDPNEKLNKEFAPIPKKTPAYQQHRPSGDEK